MQEKNLSIFEWKKIRKIYDEKQEKWYFSVIDIVWALTEQDDYTKSRKYWNKLKERLKNEWNELVTNCHQLKLMAKENFKKDEKTFFVFFFDIHKNIHIILTPIPQVLKLIISYENKIKYFLNALFKLF